MSEKINCTQAYKAMLRFFDMIALETYDEEVIIFSDFGKLYSATPGECPETMDPAMWYDWMDGLKIITGDNSVTYQFELTVEQAYAVAHQYIVIYCNLGADPSVHQLKNLIDIHAEKSGMKSWLWNHWKQSVESVLQEDPYKKIGHFFSETTGLTERESFVAMQVFLDNFCKKNNNDDLIQLIKNSRLKQRGDYWVNVPDIIEPKIWNIWKSSIDITIEQEDTKSLNLLSGYKAMTIFLVHYFNETKSDFIHQMIKSFQDYEYDKPRKFPYWGAWTTAAYNVEHEQKLMCYNTVSINTPISQDSVLKIIKKWLQDYKELLGIDFVEKILSGEFAIESIYQEEFNNIKQKQRSFLLLDDEITILEMYHIMIKLLEFHNKNVIEFQVDKEGKPVDFVILLNWIRICEQIVIPKI